MPVPKLKETQQKTERAIELKKEFERQEQQRIARQATEQANKKAAEEKEKILAAKKSRIEKARLVRQKNILLKRLMDTAATGSYLIPAENLHPSTEQLLKESDFEINDVKHDLEIVEAGLRAHWGIKQPSLEKLKTLLGKLRRFLKITIIQARRSRLNDPEELEKTTSIILKSYYQSLQSKDLRFFHTLIFRLHEFNSDDRHAEILMSDFIFDRKEYTQVRSQITQDILDIAIDVDKEHDLFDITEALLDELESESRQLKRAAEVCETVKNELICLPKGSRTISWWTKYYFPVARPESFAKELFWLSSPHGQIFLQQLTDRLEGAAESGESCLTIGLVWGYGETFLISILKKYLSSQGYEVEFKDSKSADMSMTIKW